MGPLLFISPLSGALAHALAHVDLAHLHPDGVVHDAVNDRLGRGVASEPRVPVLALELGAEHGRALLVAALHHLQEERAHAVVELLEQPLVQDEQLEARELLHELGVAPVPVDLRPPQLLDVRHI